MLWVAGISAAYGVIQYFGMDPVWGRGVNAFNGRPVSTYGNPNFLSSALALLIPLALQEMISAGNVVGTVGWGSLGLLYVAALTATLTRSSWIGASVGLVLYVTMDFKTVRMALGRALVWAGTALILVLAWPGSHSGSARPLARMGELWMGITGPGVYGSWHQRLLIWRSAWDMWKERPWGGKGWGLFELFFPYYQGRLVPLDLFRSFRTHANNAHQLFLEIGSQMGLIGLGLFFWLIVITIQTQRRRGGENHATSVSAALLAGMGALAADNVFGNVSLFFAVPAFLFFWVWGQWAGTAGGPAVRLPWPVPARRLISVGLFLLASLAIVHETRGFLAEAASFLGAGRAGSERWRSGEEDLLCSRRWRRFDVHNAYALGILYSREADEAERLGFVEEVRASSERVVTACTDALQANPGYDEIFQARAMAFQRLNRVEDAILDLRVALLINPLSLGNYYALDALYRKTPSSYPKRVDLMERTIPLFTAEEMGIRARLKPRSGGPGEMNKDTH
jgi:O-antigen ligase